jgi:general L-amino acid transport system ATP-binding protein
MSDAVASNVVRADAPPGGERIIEIEGLNKWFGDFHVLRDINMSVNKGEVVVVIGPSGSGKSTLIRCINRLEDHQEGRIVVDGVELTDDVRAIDRIRRETGMVFQQFNLFPHLTVLRNITLAPQKVRHMPKHEAEALAMELLERVGIPEQADKYPGQLSGGSSSASPSPARSRCAPRSCSSTSRPPRSTRR